jgi:hypothetical protein
MVLNRLRTRTRNVPKKNKPEKQPQGEFSLKGKNISEIFENITIRRKRKPRARKVGITQTPKQGKLGSQQTIIKDATTQQVAPYTTYRLTGGISYVPRPQDFPPLSIQSPYKYSDEDLQKQMQNLLLKQQQQYTTSSSSSVGLLPNKVEEEQEEKSGVIISDYDPTKDLTDEEILIAYKKKKAEYNKQYREKKKLESEQSSSSSLQPATSTPSKSTKKSTSKKPVVKVEEKKEELEKGQTTIKPFLKKK